MGYRKIAVDNKTYIAPLQMYGPIVNPINVTDECTITLVKKGYSVRQKMKDGTFMKLNIYNMKDPEKAKENTENKVTVKVPEKKPPVKAPEKVKESIVPTKAPIKEPAKVYDDGPRDFGQEVESVDTSIPQVEGAIVEPTSAIDNFNNDNFEAVVVNKSESEVEEDSESDDDTDESTTDDAGANPTEQQYNRKKKKKRR